MSMTLADLLCQQCKPRLLVVGDLMLDHYRWVQWTRMSPEAPVPVLRPARRQDRPGGAGSVAGMAAGLGAEVCLVSMVGTDRAGQALLRLLGRYEVDTQAVVCCPDRRTTVKERLLVGTSGRQAQPLCRIDQEQTHPIDSATANRLLEAVWQRLDWAQAVLVSDYGKGLCAGAFVPQLLAIARSAGVPVLVDPARSTDWRRYGGADCLLPNRQEAELALGMRIRSPQEAIQAAGRLVDQVGVGRAMVKLDRDGLVWADGKGGAGHFPALARWVRDVTGAGDMVLAGAGYALASGADWPTALEWANRLAALEVQRIGCQPVHRAEVRRRWACEGLQEAVQGKVVPMEVLLAELAFWRSKGRKIVLTNGCFDLLHPGHLATLEFARRQGDILVVALNSDRSVRELKGPTRPVLPQQDRAKMLAALPWVDYVVMFDTASVSPVVEQIRPDCLVKGGKEDPTSVVGRSFLESYGGRVLLGPAVPGYSTSALIEAIQPAVKVAS